MTTRWSNTTRKGRIRGSGWSHRSAGSNWQSLNPLRWSPVTTSRQTPDEQIVVADSRRVTRKVGRDGRLSLATFRYHVGPVAGRGDRRRSDHH